MNKSNLPYTQIAEINQNQPEENISKEFIQFMGDTYYKIINYDAMEPFFMSIVSSSNHWLYIASTGGLSAGRRNAELALFPYYTVDKLIENSENTGHKAILLVTRGKHTHLWEPFSDRQGIHKITRNIYKNIASTAVVFEELNSSLGLCYRYAWRTSDKFGFIKTTWLLNLNKSPCRIELIDGFQNILPANVTSSAQNGLSSLLDAYKRNELVPGTGLAIFALSAIVTDQSEPCESLLATTVWQVGLEASGYLLSSTQLDRFRAGKGLDPETDVRGRRGSYFVHANMELPPDAERNWHLIADIGQDSAAIVRLLNELRDKPSELAETIEQDIVTNKKNLEKIIACSDGYQLTNDSLCCAHHFSNVMFNVMRGGVFADQYRLRTREIIKFVSAHNHEVINRNQAFFSQLPDEMYVWELIAQAEESGQPDLVRLSKSYLPLMFSRRHGDPSRPWNHFEIDLKHMDGSLKLGFEGNWRDIFQNWEALAYSYPEFVESMICTFLNATTADGYNPYRITHNGVDWEKPKPRNPWANIGYWSDHQIIYLLKLMEIASTIHPGKLQSLLVQPMFSYANIPYRIKPYIDLLKDPYNSINFNWDLEREIESSIQKMGLDAKLLHSQSGEVLHATLSEKILTLLLAKMVNFVPEGGIWMNTQRPEWNDANNALVGKGLSVVTLSYLLRFIHFCRGLFKQSSIASVRIRSEVHTLYKSIFHTLCNFEHNLNGSFDDVERRMMMDELGQAGSNYRWDFYAQGFRDEFTELPVSDLIAFFDTALGHIEHTLQANKRPDGLYHSYNILQYKEGSASIEHLYEMLEGQVAILSSGLLSGKESLHLLTSLQNSALYCLEQNSYLLYPDQNPPGFLTKNCISPAGVNNLRLVSKLVEAKDHTLIIKDVNGNFHFSGVIHNTKDVARALDHLVKQPEYAKLVRIEKEKIHTLFESVFQHDKYTGRSGTFFAYEGLGSVYWHMVAKLLLAVQETILRTRSESSTTALIGKYYQIREGLGFNKSPDDYGAFPTDPYSHTPKGRGAQQPGMTGTVKEEILTRQGELGYFITDGRIEFDFLLLDKRELLSHPANFPYLDVDGRQQQIELNKGSLAYSVCQVPVIIQTSEKNSITVYHSDKSVQHIDNHMLDSVNSRHIFNRDGIIHHLVVSCVF